MEMMLNKLPIIFFFLYLLMMWLSFYFFLSRLFFFISNIPVKGYISKGPSTPNGLSFGARVSDAGNSFAKAI